VTLLVDNATVARVLTMRDTIEALESSYADLAAGRGVCRPRIDMRIPTGDPSRTYRWGTMEGGSSARYFAIRLKSDVVFEDRSGDCVTEEKYCVRPGLYCGLILLFSVADGAPLAILNDGVLQHMRVGADGAIGARYMAKPDARVLGMLGSGGMARSHVEALLCVRPIERLQAYSPTRAHREAFAREMAQRHGIEAVACERSEEIYRGADIVAACTDSAVPVLEGRLVEPGTHLINIGAGGRLDAASLERVDAYLRFGNAPAPLERADLTLDDEYLTWSAEPRAASALRARRGVALPGKVVYLSELLDGKKKGRTTAAQVTWSERGNLQGAQFHAVAGRAYEAARAAGLGREIPTEWLLQEIRD
jgi:ornithine cyclodeaminase/alanine dehydrogenase-like protein (mu-crystallin family)